MLNYSLKEMIILVEKNLHQNAYSKTEICELLGVSADELATTSLSANTLESKQCPEKKVNFQKL